MLCCGEGVVHGMLMIVDGFNIALVIVGVVEATVRRVISRVVAVMVNSIVLATLTMVTLGMVRLLNVVTCSMVAIT